MEGHVCSDRYSLEDGGMAASLTSRRLINTEGWPRPFSWFFLRGWGDCHPTSYLKDKEIDREREIHHWEVGRLPPPFNLRKTRSKRRPPPYLWLFQKGMGRWPRPFLLRERDDHSLTPFLKRLGDGSPPFDPEKKRRERERERERNGYLHSCGSSLGNGQIATSPPIKKEEGGRLHFYHSSLEDGEMTTPLPLVYKTKEWEG